MKQSENMFREGYYLEVIKAKYSAATAVITVKEKTVEIKNKKITTNKWLTLEDWSSLYDILEKALLQKSQAKEKKKFTRHLEIAYTFEASENSSDRTSLPTIRVGVSPLRKKSSRRKSPSSKKLKNDKKLEKFEAAGKIQSSETIESWCSGVKVEEYIPDVPNTKSTNANDDEGSKIRYIPSRKSTLEFLQQSANSNEYVPAVLSEESNANGALNVLYVPNSIPKTENLCETYEPSSLIVSSTNTANASSSTTTTKAGEEYIPNSKGLRKKVDEYQPDFTSKTMKFDDSYVPSSSQKIKELKKNDRKLSARNKIRKIKARETGDINRKESSSSSTSSSSKKNFTSGQTEIKREM